MSRLVLRDADGNQEVALPGEIVIGPCSGARYWRGLSSIPTLTPEGARNHAGLLKRALDAALWAQVRRARRIVLDNGSAIQLGRPRRPEPPNHLPVLSRPWVWA